MTAATNRDPSEPLATDAIGAPSRLSRLARGGVIFTPLVSSLAASGILASFLIQPDGMWWIVVMQLLVVTVAASVALDDIASFRRTAFGCRLTDLGVTLDVGLAAQRMVRWEAVVGVVAVRIEVDHATVVEVTSLCVAEDLVRSWVPLRFPGCRQSALLIAERAGVEPITDLAGIDGFVDLDAQASVRHLAGDVQEPG